MRRWVKIVLVATTVIILGSAYDFWRGYHEEQSISAAFGYAILSWIVYGIPVIFVLWFFDRRNKRSPNRDLGRPKS